MKRLWNVFFCAAVVLSLLALAGCASTSSKIRPQPTDNELLRNIKEVHITFDQDAGGGADDERCARVVENLQRLANARFGALGITRLTADKPDKQSVLSTRVSFSSATVTTSFSVEYSILDGGKQRRIFSEGCERWNRTDYTPGDQQKLRLVQESADSLTSDYDRVLNELCGYIVQARGGTGSK